jgi:hypothetical protein
MIVFPSYGLHARLILLRLDTGFIAYTDVSNEVAVPLRFPSFPFEFFFIREREPEEIFYVVGSLVLELAKGYSLSVEHGHHLVYP